MADSRNQEPYFTAQKCHLALRQYLKNCKKSKTCLAMLCECFRPGDRFEIDKVENFHAYKVILESVLEERSNYEAEMLEADAKTAQCEGCTFPEEGREFESCERFVSIALQAKGPKCRSCSECNGSGLNFCNCCHARGYLQCDCWEECEQLELPSESIYGKEPCDSCDGYTHCYRCPECQGRRLCAKCKGAGRTCLVQLVRINRTLLSDFQMVDLPKLLKQDPALVQKASRAEGIPFNGNEGLLKDVPARLKESHAEIQKKTGHVMTNQRLLAYQVPIARASYRCNNRQHGEFWVLGVSDDYCHSPELLWAAFSSSFSQ